MTGAVAGLRVERLRWWQLPSVLALECELFAPEQWSAELFWSELAQRPARVYLGAWDGPVLAGYAGLATGGEVAYVQTMAVAPGCQRRGLGARLLTDLIALAAASGADRIGLEVRADNGPAQRLYARHDFEAVGRRRGYYQPSGMDALVMCRDLP